MSTQHSPRTVGIGLAVVGLILVANGAWFAPMALRIPASTPMSEYAGEPAYQMFYVVHFVVLVTLAMVVRRIGEVPGPNGRVLPSWAPPLLSVVTVLNAATVYAQAFIVPFLADVAPAALDHEEIDVFAISMTAIWIAYSLTFAVVAVIGAVRRVIPVVSAVPIAFGALAMPILGPLGSVLIGAGLLFWALTRVLRPALVLA